MRFSPPRRAILGALLLSVGLAAAAQTGHFDEAEYGRATRVLMDGDLGAAVDGYCGMLRLPEREPLWTIAVMLLCETDNLQESVREISYPLPVFIMQKDFEGRVCYRVCAGLTTNRSVAIAWMEELPEEIRASGPFPVILKPCEPLAPGTVLPRLAPMEAAPDEARIAREDPAARRPPQPEPSQSPGTEPAEPAAEFAEVVLLPAEPEARPRPLSPPPAPPDTSPPASVPADPPALDTEVPGNGRFPAPEIKVAPPGTPRSAEGEAWFQKGLSAFHRGDRKEAKRCYEESLIHDPGRPETMNNLGVLFLIEDRYGDARSLFERAVSSAPAYSRAHLNLAGALWGLKEYEAAVQEARRAVALDSNDVSGHMTLASFLRAMGREEEALKEAHLVLLLAPNHEGATAFIHQPPPKKGLIKRVKEYYESGEDPHGP